MSRTPRLSGGTLTPERRRPPRRQPHPSSQPTPAQRVREGGLTQLVLAVPALYVVAAVAVAAALLLVDDAAGGSVPLLPQFKAQNARVLLAGLVGAFVTVIALVYWVRILAVQFSSDEFSSRLLRYFLVDAAQQHALGGLLGGLTYVVIVLQALPGQQAGAAAVPHLSVALATPIAVGAAATVVVAIYSGARQSQIGRLVRWLTDETVDQIRRDHPDRDTPPEDPRGEHAEAPPEEAGREVRSADSGWVQRIDEAQLLQSLPPGGTAELKVRVGVFVVEGTTLARVWDEDGQEGGQAEHVVREAVRMGTDPTIEQDPAYGITQLVDIAQRALSAGVGDSTTAYQVIVHLGLVLRELLLRDLPATTVVGEGNRRLLRPREHVLRDYVDLALARIRVADLGGPNTSLALLETIGMLVRELESAGLSERADVLREHADLVLEGVQHRQLLDWDRRRVRRTAADQGLLPDSEVGAAS